MSTKELEVQNLLQTETKIDAAILKKTVTQMNFSESAKRLLLDPNASQPDLDSLQSIALTQEHLSQIKKSLGAIVDSIQENPSIISRAAQFWGELPLWQRILGGVVITGPTLVIGAAAHVGFLITISGVSVIAYTTGGIVLDDHHHHTKSINQKLKEGIFGIAEVLELTIGALDSIRKKLTIEVNKFKEENEKLAGNIERLNDEVETLSRQVEVYVETEKLLTKAKEDLEKAANSLRNNAETQTLLLEANQREAAKIKEEHTKSLQLLAEKTNELAKVRETMGTELDKAKKIATTLESTVKILSGAVLSDTSQREVFKEKLNNFLVNKTTNFELVAQRMNETETELAEVKSELKASNERYKKLLDLQEMQIRRLERLDRYVETGSASEPVAPSKEPTKPSGLLSSLGFMAWPAIGGNQHPDQTKLVPPSPKTHP